ncbi:MAG: ComF family protein [Dehalococcoidales bacterium]|nr:ComF family protein [Dehalococcoidales bacterium]
MLPQLAKIKGVALDFIFPRYCVGCGREGEFLCFTCLRTANRVMPPISPKCGRPQPSGVLCSDCINWSSGIDGIRSPFRFEGVIREAIHQLKYRNLRALSPTLAEFLYEHLINYPLPADVIVPVPLHPKRLRERGYNQSLLLARELGKLTGLPLVENSLIRQRHTVPQARTASVSQRQQNISGAFICRNQELTDYKILLIDDVSTSGNTLDTCAKAMKAAGAISVWGLTVAREI